jgi:hypothetical protein
VLAVCAIVLLLAGCAVLVAVDEPTATAGVSPQLQAELLAAKYEAQLLPIATAIRALRHYYVSNAINPRTVSDDDYRVALDGIVATLPSFLALYTSMDNHDVIKYDVEVPGRVSIERRLTNGAGVTWRNRTEYSNDLVSLPALAVINKIKAYNVEDKGWYQTAVTQSLDITFSAPVFSATDSTNSILQEVTFSISVAGNLHYCKLKLSGPLLLESVSMATHELYDGAKLLIASGALVGVDDGAGSLTFSQVPVAPVARQAFGGGASYALPISSSLTSYIVVAHGSDATVEESGLKLIVIVFVCIAVVILLLLAVVARQATVSNVRSEKRAAEIPQRLFTMLVHSVRQISMLHAALDMIHARGVNSSSTSHAKKDAMTGGGAHRVLSRFKTSMALSLSSLPRVRADEALQDELLHKMFGTRDDDGNSNKHKKRAASRKSTRLADFGMWRRAFQENECQALLKQFASRAYNFEAPSAGMFDSKKPSPPSIHSNDAKFQPLNVPSSPTRSAVGSPESKYVRLNVGVVAESSRIDWQAGARDLDLADVLQHPVTCAMFKENLVVQRSHEVLVFYKEVHRFKQIKSAALRHAFAQELCNNYVHPESPCAINVSGAVSKGLLAIVAGHADNIGPSLFDEAQSICYRLMLTNFWDAFRASPDYIIACWIANSTVQPLETEDYMSELAEIGDRIHDMLRKTL